MVRPLRMILNTFYSGPQAWFFVAADRGYFAEAGLEVHFTEGDTLANAVPKVASGAFDVGYGDLNALIETVAIASLNTAPLNTPLAVSILHNASPYTIAVDAEGPIQTPADLAGRHLVSHPGDAALRMFPEFAAATEIDVASVQVAFDARHHKHLIADLLAQRAPWVGLFGFVNTLASAAIEAGIAPERLRHLEWRTHVPDLCGAAIIVTRDLATREPEVVRGFVHAVDRALYDVIADADAAIEAVARRNPAMDRAANRARLVGTLGLEMAHADGVLYGLGEIDIERLSRAITLIAACKRLPRIPWAEEVFTADFLPPRPGRARVRS